MKITVIYAENPDKEKPSLRLYRITDGTEVVYAVPESNNRQGNQVLEVSFLMAEQVWNNYTLWHGSAHTVKGDMDTAHNQQMANEEELPSTMRPHYIQLK